jgi:hypothetical protein
MTFENLERVAGFLDTDIFNVKMTAESEDYQRIKSIIEERTGLTIEQAIETLQGIRDCIADVITDGEQAEKVDKET